ncbi:GIN domain-containing protein [Persicobacter psychrovividus]|uniref:Phage shock protein C (PspC) family protein n=1 Tax=Persicobacter psychrovividus TaxID=387638 RepID=A0ABN6L6Z1_9BACT|nr:hypothetical protein PEPS_12820 [Persicobacter psychrovividus]
MKKSLSISIGGIIFHIDEDGYLILNEYLENIRQHFSPYPDSYVIIEDIENRIAEIFMGKLDEQKQAITLEDVEELMETLGSINDFETFDNNSQYSSNTTQEDEAEDFQVHKRFFRDTGRKVIGGVLAGLGRYFHVDPLWIRIGFLIFFFGFSLVPSLAAAFAIIYLCLSLILPERVEFPEDKNDRQIFRNPDNKVLGGICSGIAAFYKLDVMIIRLIFVALIFFGGSAIFIYLILWALLEEANTPSQKVKMQGQPINLQNIEQSIRKSLKNLEGQETNLTKILLLPFRVLSEVFKFLQKALGPVFGLLIDIVRIAFGAMTSLVGISLLVTIVVALLIRSNYYFPIQNHLPFDIQLFTSMVSPALTGVAFLILIIPSLYLIFLGIMILSRRVFGNPAFHISMFVFWGIALVSGFILGPMEMANFKSKGTFEQLTTAEIPQDSLLTIQVNENNGVDFSQVRLNIQHYKGSEIKLEQQITAYGPNPQEAKEFAKQISYNALFNEGTLMLDQYFAFPEVGTYHMQHVKLNLFLPEGLKFKVGPQVHHILGSRGRDMPYLSTNKEYKVANGRISCMDCPKEASFVPSEVTDYIHGYYENIPIEKCDELEVNGAFEVELIQSADEFLIVNGDEELVNNTEVAINQNKITIGTRGGGWLNNSGNGIRVIISAPKIRHIKLGGACELETEKEINYKQPVSISATGASKVFCEGRFYKLEATASGASKMSFTGFAEQSDFQAAGASKIDAIDLRTAEVKCRASGASKIKVWAEKNLKADASGSSKIQFKGEPRSETSSSGASKVSRY